MKVKISITLDIDPESWTMNYGIEGAAEIRADVKAHATHSMREFYGPSGLDLLMPDK